MDANASKPWLTAPPNAPTQNIQHPLQLGGPTAQATLVPAENQTAHLLQGKLYLPQPTSYLAPVAHERIATHQQPVQQSPANTNPVVGSSFFLPITPTSGVQ